MGNRVAAMWAPLPVGISSPAEALRSVASSWGDKQGTFGFPRLDWEAVTQALLAVRAI